MARLPERLVVEALINLLRTNWIEVRSLGGVFFRATSAGRRRALEQTLPPQIQRSIKWASLCFDRITGSWLRADDLDLVYERDLPFGTYTLEPVMHTYHTNDGMLRELFYLAPDEALEPADPQFKNPSRPYARVTVAFDRIESGLPNDASVGLIDAILEASVNIPDLVMGTVAAVESVPKDLLFDVLHEDDFIVGGAHHRESLSRCFGRAKSHIVLHSCFLDPRVLEGLLPDLESAGRRRVRVDLLWGLHFDPEDPKSRNVLAESERVLNKLSGQARELVQLSPVSSGSHAKCLIFDDEDIGWVSVIGSCNYLSSWFTAIDISVSLRSPGFTRRLLGYLLSAQLPASGNWSPVARRLNAIWDNMRGYGNLKPETGSHRLRLFVDKDHYSCVREARNMAKKDIVIGCDIYGMAAETSVLVPMARAVELGRGVRLLYQRPSKQIQEAGRAPSQSEAGTRGIVLEQHEGLHGKFIIWDEDHLGITSFNWLATSTDGTRARGAELGVLIEGPRLRSAIGSKLLSVSNGAIRV